MYVKKLFKSDAKSAGVAFSRDGAGQRRKNVKIRGTNSAIALRTSGRQRF